jgi:hypothetical protein
MKKILAVLAVLASLSIGAAFAEESVDCFNEANANHPACKK